MQPQLPSPQKLVGNSWGDEPAQHFCRLWGGQRECRVFYSSLSRQFCGSRLASHCMLGVTRTLGNSAKLSDSGAIMQDDVKQAYLTGARSA